MYSPPDLSSILCFSLVPESLCIYWKIDVQWIVPLDGCRNSKKWGLVRRSWGLDASSQGILFAASLFESAYVLFLSSIFFPTPHIPFSSCCFPVPCDQQLPSIHAPYHIAVPYHRSRIQWPKWPWTETYPSATQNPPPLNLCLLSPKFLGHLQSTC